jgi:hypothetical protein
MHTEKNAYKIISILWEMMWFIVLVMHV